jgi:hypothetical protein
VSHLPVLVFRCLDFYLLGTYLTQIVLRLESLKQLENRDNKAFQQKQQQSLNSPPSVEQQQVNFLTFITKFFIF